MAQPLTQAEITEIKRRWEFAQEKNIYPDGWIHWFLAKIPRLLETLSQGSLFREGD